MPQRVLALEIDASELKAALVEVAFRDYRVLGLFRDAVVPDGSSVGEQLRRFVDKHQLGDANTVVSAIPGDAVTWRRMTLPFRDRKRLDQTVPFELEAQVPFGLEDVVIDYHVLERGKEASDVLAAMVPREDLQLHLHTLEEAGLDPKIVDVAPLAALNGLRLSEKAVPDDFVYISGGGRRLGIAVYRDKKLAGLRTLVVTAPNPEAEDPARDEATRLQALSAEVGWSLTALNGAPLPARMPCIVWGDGPYLPQIVEDLKQQGLDVRRFSESASRHLPEPWPRELTPFAVPIGLALREAMPGEALGLNFRRGEFSYQRTQDEFRQALKRTGMLAALVLAMIVGNTYVEQQRLEARYQALSSAVAQVFGQTLQGVRPAGDPVKQMQAAIDEEQKKLAMLGDVVPLDGATAIDALRELAIAVPAELKVEVEELTMDTGQIRLRALSDTYDTVDAVKQKIVDRKYFSAVEVKNVKSNPEGGVNYLVLLALGRGEVE